MTEANKQKQWIQEHIKNLPPINVAEDQRKEAQYKIQKIKQLKNSKLNSV